MTAPNIPANGGAGDSAKLLDMDDAAFAASIGLEKTHPTPAEEKPRDTDGKFIAKDKVLADTTLAKDKVEAPTDTAPADAAPSETPAEGATEPAESQPDTTAEEKPVEPVKPPLTKFQAFDAEGEVEPPSDLLLKYKVDGKIVENDLVKTVHLAQQATFNARQVQELTERNTAGGQQLDQALQDIQQREAALDQMFRDPNLYARAQALYLAANTPERIAEAAQAEATQVRQNYQQQQESQAVVRFVEDTIGPALLELAKEYPTVGIEDLTAHLAMRSKPYEVNGRVPLANMSRIAHIVNTEIAEYAATAHAKRTEASRAASKTLDKERAVTQSKQRQMGKALAPVGASAGTAPTPPPIVRARDVLNDPLFGGPQ